MRLPGTGPARASGLSKEHDSSATGPGVSPRVRRCQGVGPKTGCHDKKCPRPKTHTGPVPLEQSHHTYLSRKRAPGRFRAVAPWLVAGISKHSPRRQKVPLCIYPGSYKSANQGAKLLSQRPPSNIDQKSKYLTSLFSCVPPPGHRPSRELHLLTRYCGGKCLGHLSI